MEKEKKNKTLLFCLTESEHIIIKKLSAKERVSMSEFIRSLIRESAKKENIWREKELA